MQSTRDVFCKSVHMYDGKCIKGPIISNKITPYECINNSTYTEKCIYNFANRNFYFDCQCGINSNGESFCPLSSGEIKYMNYFPTIINILLNDCHTLARNNFKQCPKIEISTNNYKNILIKFKQYSMHPKIQKNSICVKETILFDYYHNFGHSQYLKLNSFRFIYLLSIFIIFF